ncbi:hypothetical protein [Mycolicibacterium peregrinum]|uniref:hypothetical protein n=1 Tax=Mycolicibacterium peregrinum TaxID=43304 RepID=UPI003AACB093
MFAGRQPNIELQLPHLRRILERNPDVECHIWDLARDPKDSAYLRTIEGDRITVRADFYDASGKASRGQVKVWKHYANKGDRNTLYVKLDDDVVFLESNRFDTFIDAIDTHPDHVISALTINNGASTPHIPDIWDAYQQLDIPLLDVHLSAEYAELSHRWFFANWQAITNRPALLIPTEDWVSINCIGMTHQMLHRIAEWIGRPSPRLLAGRAFHPVRNRLGDEGATNVMPRLIHEGFVAAHLNFGPQVEGLKAVSDELRKMYADVDKQYLTQ